MRKSMFILAVFTLLESGVFAHPHVKLDAKLTFEFDSTSCTGFWVDWTFDKLFSMSIIQECDADKNGAFSSAESAKVQQYAFDNLKKYGYFLYLRKGSTRSNPSGVERFTASQKDGTMTYRFFVNLAGKNFGSDFYVAVFDSTYYCAAVYVPAPVEFRVPAGAAQPKWTKAVNKQAPVYYNPAGASTDFTIYDKWKPGLETAYPEEIHVSR